MPRWSGLHHFDSILPISFNDGTKLQDLSKVRYTEALLGYSLNVIIGRFSSTPLAML